MGKVINSEMWTRIENLMLHKGWTWHQMAEEIDLSTGMLSMVKTGTRGLSKKAVYRLEHLERAAGLAPSVLSVVNPPPSTSVKTHSEGLQRLQKMDRAAARRAIELIRRGLNELEKALES